MYHNIHSLLDFQMVNTKKIKMDEWHFILKRTWICDPSSSAPFSQSLTLSQNRSTKTGLSSPTASVPPHIKCSLYTNVESFIKQYLFWIWSASVVVNLGPSANVEPSFKVATGIVTSAAEQKEQYVITEANSNGYPVSEWNEKHMSPHNYLVKSEQ